MANNSNSQQPRKFSEKIAQLNKSENESNERFNQIMMEVKPLRDPVTVSYGGGGSLYPGGPWGSLPNIVHGLQNTAHLPQAHMGQASDDLAHMQRGFAAKSHRPTPYPLPSRIQMEPPIAPSPYLPVPTNESWRRFKSDSDIRASAMHASNGPKSSSAAEGQAGVLSPPMNKRVFELMPKEQQSWEPMGTPTRHKSIELPTQSQNMLNDPNRMVNGGVNGGTGSPHHHQPHVLISPPAHGGPNPLLQQHHGPLANHPGPMSPQSLHLAVTSCSSGSLPNLRDISRPHRYSQPLVSLLTAGNDPMLNSAGGQGPGPGGGMFDKFVDTTMPPPDSPQRGGPQSPVVPSPPALMVHPGPMGPQFQPHKSAIKEKLQQVIAARHMQQIPLNHSSYRNSSTDPSGPGGPVCHSPTSPSSASLSQASLHSPEGALQSDVFNDTYFQQHQQQQSHLLQRFERINMDNQHHQQQQQQQQLPTGDPMFGPMGQHSLPISMAPNMNGSDSSPGSDMYSGRGGFISFPPGGGGGRVPYTTSYSMDSNNSYSNPMIPNIILTPECESYGDFNPLAQPEVSPGDQTGGDNQGRPGCNDFFPDKLGPINCDDLRMLNDPNIVTDSGTEDRLRQDSLPSYGC